MNGIKTLGILRNRSGFTLAEMMVVMLILSIVMAAFAPIMTRRNKTDFKSPWATVNNDASGSIYFINSKVEDLASARIGFDGSYDNLAGANYARLLINAKDGNWNALGFMYNGDQVGVINMRNNSSILIGTAGNYSNNLAYVPNHETSAIAYVRPIEYKYYAVNSTPRSECYDKCINSGKTLLQCQYCDQYSDEIGIDGNTTISTETAGGYIDLENPRPSNVTLDSNNKLHQNVVGIGKEIISAGVNSVIVGNITSAGANAVSIGYGAQGDSTSNDSVAIGAGALNKNSSEGLVAVGFRALSTNSTGTYNTAIGTDALKTNTTGSYNVAVGYNSLQKTTGSSNTAVGYNSLQNATGAFNTAVGSLSLNSVTSGQKNVAFGNNTLFSNVTSDDNTAIGYEALYNTTGEGNTALGSGSLKNNKSGTYNIGIGTGPMSGCWGGDDGSCINNTGSDNIAIGRYALRKHTSGNGNVAIGTWANDDVVGDLTETIAIGYSAEARANRSVAIGPSAISSTNSIAIGYNSRALNNTIAIGQNACTNVTGNNKICIGNNSGPQSSDGTTDETVYIGGKSYFNGGDAVLEVHNPNYGTGYSQGWSSINNEPVPSSTVVINGNLVVKGVIMTQLAEGNNQHVNDSHAKVLFGDKSNGAQSYIWKNGPIDSDAASQLYYNKKYGYEHGAFRSYSDHRLKNITGANSDGLSKIQQLKVYNFTFKQDPKKMPHTGVIAQDLQKIFPNSVIKGEDGYLVIRWDEMFYAMINAVKELAAKINVIDSRVTRLEKENAQLRAQNAALEARLTAIEKSIKK